MVIPRLVLVAPFLVALQQPATPPPDTDIFLASLRNDSGTLVPGTPVNITTSPGYDNQPSFTPDGTAILFTSVRGVAAQNPTAAAAAPQTDIHRYEIATRRVTRVTSTAESEYSPTVTPDAAHVSVIRVERDGTQRLWRFAVDGGWPELVLPDVKPVGYHAWADAGTLGLFVLGKPATLHIADTRSGKATEVAKDIGRSLHRMPGGHISFIQRVQQGEGGPAALIVMELDGATRSVTRLVPAPRGATEADVAWTPDGALLTSYEDVLYLWRRGQPDWTRVADLGSLGLKGVTRLAVSPKGDYLAIVAASTQ